MDKPRTALLNRAMILRTLLLSTMLAAALPSIAAEKDTRSFEMRTYYAAPGKLELIGICFLDAPRLAEDAVAD